MAFKSIGNDAGAEATLKLAEEALGAAPSRLASVATHVLVRQAQVKVLGKERTVSEMP